MRAGPTRGRVDGGFLKSASWKHARTTVLVAIKALIIIRPDASEGELFGKRTISPLHDFRNDRTFAAIQAQ